MPTKVSKKTQKILDQTRRNKFLSIAGVTLAIVAIAFIGIQLTFGSHAATPFISLQAEAGTVSGSASAIQDATASGGTAIKFATASTGGKPYVQPNTQGYRGALSALPLYSAANGQVPNSSCAWNQTYKFLNCSATDMTLDSVYVQGGIYWSGCGKLTINNSVVDWYPSKTWHDIQMGCATPQADASVTMTNSTLQTSPSVMTYTGGSGIGGINEHAGDSPMFIYNSLIRGFPEGLFPPGDSIIKNNEIYVQDAQCPGEVCHSNGLFSQGGSNILYEGNYIVSQIGSQATSAIFYQGPRSTGNRVIGNYLKGGSYTFYNQTSFGLVVQNNTFGGGFNGDATNCGAGSCGSITTWTNNLKENGATVPNPQ